jgi:hypothetical protein
VSVCFCTLAIHAPYRERARLLCADLAPAPIVVLTDEPADFADLPVRAIGHEATGPMAIDYLQRLAPTGGGRGAAAYHDKRFAVQAALQRFETAIFLDADSRLEPSGSANVLEHGLLGAFPAGLSVVPLVRKSVAEHLESCGSWRRPVFEALARLLTGSTDVLKQARWCHETCYAVTPNGHQRRFFDAWERGAEYLQRAGVYSGEGGVMGLAAACAGWATDYDALAPLDAVIRHEGGGPKGP